MLKRVQHMRAKFSETTEQVILGSVDLVSQMCCHGSFLKKCPQKKARAYFYQCRRRAAKTWLLLAIIGALSVGCKGYQRHKAHRPSQQPVVTEMAR